MPQIKLTIKRDGDVIEATVLEDGQVRLDVQGEISFANHGSADEAVAQVEKLLGGTTDVQKHGHHTHEHAHGHAHTHSHKH
jgi:hypothetical protein